MNYIFILLFTIINMSAKAPEFIAHSHSYSDIDKLVQDKEKSTLTYKQIMQQFSEGYLMLQEGVVNQDKLPIRIGLDMILNHPSPSYKPWVIVKDQDKEGFKETLLYYDQQLYNTGKDIEQSLDTNNWIQINKRICNLSKLCVNCHITWKDNLK